MEHLTKGTKEYLVVDIEDRLGGITTLVGTNPIFDVRVRDATGWVQQNQVVSVNVMKALCLIDTTLAGYVAGSVFELFITFTAAPEAPRLGPFAFDVS
jgi:hypothetical protein